MARFSRSLIAFLFALSFLTFGARAHAIPKDKTTSIGAAPPPAAAGPARERPLDAPMDSELTRESIPHVPSSYITKELGWLELSYPPSAAERVASIIQDADAVKADLVAKLGQDVLTHVTVRVAPTVSDMAKLAPSEAPPPEYASGVAYHGLHLVLLSMLVPRGAEAVDLDEVFRHELAHVALEDAVQGKHVPVWFNEGLAIALSGESWGDRMQTLASATLSGTLIPLNDLDRSFPRDDHRVGIAYAESADFMRFLTRKSDQLRFAAMISRVREGQPFDRAVTEAYGSDLRRLELEWRSDLDHRFSVIPILTGGGLLWVLVIGGMGFVYIRRRRRTKAILERWAVEEAIEDARLAKAAADQAANPNEAVVVGSLGRTAAALKVEHHGDWHTLH